MQFVLLTCVIIHVLYSLTGADICPDPNSFGRRCMKYHDNCQSNADCTGGQRCCLVAGCGKECMTITPERPRPGVCPKPKPYTSDLCARILLLSDCKKDSDCKGNKKCCERLCNVLQCTDPLLDRPECPNIDLFCKGYADYCKSDKECSTGTVCCYSRNCGRSCQKPLVTDVCKLPKVVGPCDGVFIRYYWDTNTKSCRKFEYGGCGGNGNNFLTKAQCEQKCGPKCGPVCLIFCPFGNVLDDNDCPICKCKTGCRNNVPPLKNMSCQDGVNRCPGRYTCVTPPGSSTGVCCPID